MSEGWLRKWSVSFKYKESPRTLHDTLFSTCNLQPKAKGYVAFALTLPEQQKPGFPPGE